MHEDCKETAKRKDVSQDHCSPVQGEVGCLANTGFLVSMGTFSPECTEYHVVMWIYS